mmetsp:Transcript_33646/g.95156  ORF Transcript_33646/g.95156 Transcript_33646/m.95156 type:complete len:532 (+) Transcript_33646:298-1893(+)
MTADFDEYDYLEKQIEKKQTDDGPKEEPKEGKRSEVEDDEKPRSEKSSRKHRSRSKSRDRDRSGRKRHSRSKSRDRHKSRDSDRKRSRDRSRDVGRDRDKDGGRSHSRGHRSRSRERRDVPPPRRERTPPEVRAQRERDRELEELERDTRTVFAYNVNTRATDKDIFEFFSQAGTVMDVRIITDRNTKRSKGFAYIEMSNKLEIAGALSLSGQPLLGQSVMVKASEAEKNMAWEAAQATQQANMVAPPPPAFPSLLGMGTGPCKLQVANVHPNVVDSDLHSIFAPFGELDFATITKDVAGGSMGVGFVQYKQMGDAAKAMQQLNDLEIAGLKIQVTVAPVLPVMPEMSAAPPTGMNVSELDEEDGGGLKLSAQSRAALMARLSGVSTIPGSAGSGANTTPLGPPPAALLPTPPGPPPLSNNPLALEQGVLGPKSPIATPCVLLKNMFDPSTETEPDWEVEIGEDVKDECSKFGPVLHHHVDKMSKGFVYLKFATVDAAQKAQSALNGRWFAGREVIAEFQFASVYDAHFQC